MSPQKHYTNCGIQTDFSAVNQSLSLCEPKLFPSPVGHSCVLTGSDVPSSESDVTLANGSLVFESAYNQSPDSPSMLSSSRYCLTGIPYSRPSEPRLSAKKRILSLTSVSPVGKLKATMFWDKLRLVSMPERGKYAGVLTKDSLLEKWHSDDDLDGTISHEQTERPYPVDLPQTPSPPSSPESVTIIGNNAHVPGSFLRQPGYIDDDGWVSWANSPPRPIPALHGPLSLPYARCPSGAEGTLVEGDELSHKIWGLGIDDSQIVHLPSTNRPSVRQGYQPHHYRPSQAPPLAIAISQDEFALSHYHERDTVIDLSQPATFYGHVGTQRVFSKQNTEHIISASRQTRDSQRANAENLATLQAKNLKLEKAGHSSSLAVGLGLHTWPSRGSRQEDVSGEIPSNPLNTAAPIFVPASANMRAYSSKQRYGCAPQSENALPYAISALRRPSVFNSATEQHQHFENILPTPPSTSSPCWTPIFSHQPEMAISKSMVSETDLYSPNIYSPISDLEDDSHRIRAIIQQSATHETDIAYDSEVVPQTRSSQRDPFTIQAYLPKLAMPQVDHVSSCLKVTSSCLRDPSMTFSTNHENNPHDGDLLQVMQTGSTRGSTERRRNLSYQQPRSIPLARLIQRRLSSVTEEDLSTKILLPFLQEAQTGEFTASKGPPLEPFGRQTPKIGLLDEDIFTTEIFSVNTEADHQPVYDESMLGSGESNVVVKLPPKASVMTLQ